jgi:hypothetical protein
MPKYTFQATHPNEVFVSGGKPHSDGDTIELSNVALRAAVSAGVHFKEVEPKEGEPIIPRRFMSLPGDKEGATQPQPAVAVATSPSASHSS